MHKIYCGVDLHSRLQTVAYCSEADGEIHIQELDHQKDDIRGFYSKLDGQVLVGFEATGYSPWFESLLEELGIEFWIGNSTEIRRAAKRRRKNDRLDAELILDMLMRGDFPRIHYRPFQNTEILRNLRYRHRLVKMNVMTKNYLQSLAISGGLSKRTQLYSKRGRLLLSEAKMTPIMRDQSDHWLSLLDELERRIAEAESWLKEKAKGDSRVELLQTHPGIGLLTSLALVHTLDPLERFSNQQKVTAYVGLDPIEASSAEKIRFRGISKGGSRLLRHLLGEAGLTAIRGDSDLKRFYSRICYRRGHAKAKVAVARKLLLRSYIMLRDNIDYAEFLRRGVEARPARPRHRTISS